MRLVLIHRRIALALVLSRPSVVMAEGTPRAEKPLIPGSPVSDGVLDRPAEPVAGGAHASVPSGMGKRLGPISFSGFL